MEKFTYDNGYMSDKHDASSSVVQAIIHNAIDGIITIDQRGKIESFNPAAGKLFGYLPEEVIGKNVSLLMPSPDRDMHDVYISNYQRTGEKKIIGIGREVKGLRKDGTTFPFRLSVSEVHLADRVIYAGIIHDISALKDTQFQLEKSLNELKELTNTLEQRVEERTAELSQQILEKERISMALRENQQLLTAIMRNYPNGMILVLNQDFRIILAEGEELQRISTNVNLGFSRLLFEQLGAFMDVEKFKTFLVRAASGEAVKFEFQARDQFYQASATLLPGVSSQLSLILLVAENVTELKQAEIQLQENLSKEKELGQIKSRFVSMASHEFRTPLSSILTSASLIEKYTTEEEQEKRLKHTGRIKSAVGNLTNLLNDFLSLSKLEEGKFEVIREEFCIKKFMEELLEEHEFVSTKNQKLVVEHKVDSEVYLDKKMLKNIVSNILSNSLKYSYPNSTVLISTSRPQPGTIQIMVRDEGIGIPPQELNQLYDRFFRASNATHIQGTGLGMNIVKKFMDLMEGEIHIESKENVGTTVYLNFPQLAKPM